MEYELMELTSLAAWWGASVATLLLFWDIYKWKKSGPNIIVKVLTNRVMVRMGPGKGIAVKEGVQNIYGPKFVSVTVTNRGTQMTTLTKLMIFQFKTPVHKITRKKPSKMAIIPHPLHSEPFPRKLEPGEKWYGGIDQSEIDEEMKKESLYCAVEHTGSTRPQLARLKWDNSDAKPLK